MAKPTRSYNLRIYGGLLVIALAAAVLYLISVANGPDRELTFARTIPATTSTEELDRAMHALINWPNWFHSLERAEAIDIAGRPYPMKDQVAMAGGLIKLYIDPNKGPWRKFVLLVQVIRYVPNRELAIQVTGDSSDRLTRLFDHLEWRIELLPQANGKMMLRGTASARTRHWRARLFGALFEKILMNQVFYPDLLKLADLHRVTETNPFLPTQQ